jgi:GNAT superfamily N-acetyltransferase
MIIRNARIEDLDAILAMLQRDSFTYRPEQAADFVRAFHDIDREPNNELIVAERDGDIVGTLQLTFIPGMTYGGAWRAQVEAVRVREDLRNLQIGTKLMHWVIERAKERGCGVVQLTTNVARVDAQRFYKRLGFEASHVGMKLTL